MMLEYVHNELVPKFMSSGPRVDIGAFGRTQKAVGSRIFICQKWIEQQQLHLLKTYLDSVRMLLWNVNQGARPNTQGPMALCGIWLTDNLRHPRMKDDPLPCWTPGLVLVLGIEYFGHSLTWNLIHDSAKSTSRFEFSRVLRPVRGLSVSTNLNLIFPVCILNNACQYAWFYCTHVLFLGQVRVKYIKNVWDRSQLSSSQCKQLMWSLLTTSLSVASKRLEWFIWHLGNETNTEVVSPAVQVCSLVVHFMVFVSLQIANCEAQ